ncbi:Nup170p KNAG_0B02300 [Huiozyma naganishii CBS 8797]|uniref:Nucleoporin Nup133/Nup155-like N-terminal domain-containing protein n=1 Tax=Huiozyma naganishii (strain ATCC MYA-139 / BCRC 22969 / CBS 8797 / KCTC 17520 / NBRC 10181 / NCYC 3082 / Yp74L-3) TaxID=1071383 RepID=J7RUX3_HUIN7|nr:hypothetical protein KNAG_0B02300 [Kazachstania naganishii CBS 8797]CCK68672.1 hypothetical protein KNAG_0B02300 [Kazachstania naganishii CBS 8797]
MFSTPLKNRMDYGSTPFNPTQNNNAGSMQDGKHNELNNSVPNMISMQSNLNSNPGAMASALANNHSLDSTASINSNFADVNEHIRVNGIGTKEPLHLASEYVDHLYNRDLNTPVLDERSYYNNGVNYNFSREVGGLGAFTPFERTSVINIPDKLLQEASKTEIKSDMGLFPQLDRCWITIDNKLILWNINDPNDFQCIEEIKHTILSVALVKPKPNTFVDAVKHLLLISTPFDIYILAVSWDKKTNDLNVYNSGMSVSISGMGLLDIASYEKTGQVFFVSKSNGLNVWELQYTGSDDWFNSKCNKVCLTQSTWSNLLPTNLMSKIPGTNLVQSLFEEAKYTQEVISQMTVDQSRGIIYTLSSKSSVRAYRITDKKLEGPFTIEPSYISRIIGTTTARGAAILGKKYLKISKIIPVSQKENGDLFFILLTVGGVRLYFNGSIGRSNIEAIRLESIKFPPSAVTPDVLEQEMQQQQLEQQKKNLPFYFNLSYSESILLKLQKKSSVLLETTKVSTVISPGIFFSAVVKSHSQQSPPYNSSQVPNSTITNPPVTPFQSSTTNTTGAARTATNTATAAKNSTGTIQQPTVLQHRLFVSVPDYGILKNHGKYVENATFLDTDGPVKDIIPLSPLFNATDKPAGYANEFATQYTTDDFRIAVLTNSSIEIYRYRTPDEVFELLIDNPLPFVLNYGLSEACSTALFVTCKFNKPELLRSAALTFLTVGIPGVVDIKPRYNRYSPSTVSSFLNKPSLSVTGSRGTSSLNATTNFSLDDVILSPRFYGMALLMTRLFRDIWDKPIFQAATNLKYDQMGNVISTPELKDKSIISRISISKPDIEYYLSSVMILNEFFSTYGDSITQLSTPSLAADRNVDKGEEVANQAENIAVNSLIRLVFSVKESLSFLNVLYEESEIEGFEHQYLAFENILKELQTNVQNKLLKLKFKDIFAPNESTKASIREILLSIINRNINKGASIEYTATILQERCGSFCSSNDILSFKALEHLKKTKEIKSSDYDGICYHLDNAIKLLQSIANELTVEKLKEAVSIMLSVNYYPKTIEFLLNIANSIDRGKLAYQYVANGCLENDERKNYYEKRIVIYDLVFDTLVKVDELTASNPSSIKGPLLMSKDAVALKNESYDKVLHYDDKLFHYCMYDWLVSQGSEDRLLQLDTNYILPYLEEKSKGSLKITNLMWIYHSRKGNFLKAAEILYNLAISDFEIKLNERIECLSRANSFCNSDCPPSQKQGMVQLTGTIQELFEITSVQDDTLSLVSTDTRIATDIKVELMKNLDSNILPVSDLFNDYAVPLGYHEIALTIFKISDFRDQEEIMAKWEELFDSLKRELNTSGKIEDSRNFIALLSNVVVKVGKKVHTSEFVFPISELFPRICNLFYENLPHDHIKPGSVISIFVSAQVSYNKLYYVLKDLIEVGDPSNKLFDREMVWLIKEWFKSDRKLSDIIPYNEIEQLKEYSIESDPIEKYHKRTGNSV